MNLVRNKLECGFPNAFVHVSGSFQDVWQGELRGPDASDHGASDGRGGVARHVEQKGLQDGARFVSEKEYFSLFESIFYQ